MWVGSEDGVFRVKDAYSLALRAQIEEAHSNGADPIWKYLWKLRIHPKARMFLWRAVWDILPHGSNLSRKGIENVDKCTRCGLLETNSHVLKDCKWAQEVWQQVMNSSDIPQQLSFREWFGMMMERKTHAEVELFAMCAWQIWSARNDLCFNKVFISSDHCYKKASDLLQEYKKATASDPTTKNRRENAKWSPPGHGHVKINVDTAVNTQEDRFGLGVVARNSDGAIMLAASKTMWNFHSVERAEIEGFLWAVELIKEQQ